MYKASTSFNSTNKLEISGKFSTKANSQNDNVVIAAEDANGTLAFQYAVVKGKAVTISLSIPAKFIGTLSKVFVFYLHPPPLSQKNHVAYNELYGNPLKEINKYGIVLSNQLGFLPKPQIIRVVRITLMLTLSPLDRPYGSMTNTGKDNFLGG